MLKNGYLFKVLGVILYLFVASILVLTFKANFLTSTVLYFIIPSLYFTLLNHKPAFQVLIFSLIYGTIISLIADYGGNVLGFWYVPETIFPFRIFSFIPLENLIWGISGTYSSVMFYKSFVDPKKFDFDFKLFLVFVFGSSILFALFLSKVSSINSFPYIPYFFAVGSSLLFFPPIILILILRPKFFNTIVLTLIVYVFVLGFEVTGVLLSHWVYFPTAEVIGWIYIFGAKFPIEEFFAFFIIGPIANIIYYKIFFEKLISRS